MTIPRAREALSLEVVLCLPLNGRAAEEMAQQGSQLVLSPFISEYSLEQEEKGQKESLSSSHQKHLLQKGVFEHCWARV